MSFEQRAGWRVDKSGAGYPPSVDIVELLMRERREPTLPDEPTKGTFFEITINHLIIFADRYTPLPIAKWTRTYTIEHPLQRPPGASRVLNAGISGAHVESIDRLVAERRALSEMEEESLSSEDRELLLEKRKGEYDAAWGINPESPTNHQSLRIVK